MFVFRGDKFKIRLIICLAVVTAMVILSVGRIGAIATDSSVVASANNFVSVELESGRGDFYDCNGKKITGAANVYANVFFPTETGKAKFEKYADENELAVGKRNFLNNKPAVLKRDFEIVADGVCNFEVKDRYGDICSLEHILGYINFENKGVTGLEKSYDELLSQSATITASFYIDAAGNYLLGAQPLLSDETYNNSVYLTIDKDIQKICESAMATTYKGAVVVTETKSGKIRAILSKPDYDIKKISEYLEREDAPLLNRAINCYSTGSVFKPMIAAALIENGKDNFCYECTGICNISGKNFHCYNRAGHGKIDLSKALYFSCNTYFYNAVNLLQPKCYTSLATSLMFDMPIKLAEGIVSKAGTVPDNTTLSLLAAAANFSIGQGSVLLSPLAIGNLYSAIANDGYYFSPTLIEGICENGNFKTENQSVKNIVMSKGTAAVLKEYLSYVVSFGTGVNALPKNGGAAGKTATAQTGKYAEDKELVNAWFCGFFPKDTPEYTVTVFLEESHSGGSDCAPIFKAIADGINSLN